MLVAKLDANVILLLHIRTSDFTILCLLRYYQTSDREFLIRVSYLEIYNEEINDLFAVENQKLQIHESLEVSYWLKKTLRPFRYLVFF